MARCGGCSKASACCGCLLLVGAIVLGAWPIFTLTFKVPGEFAVRDSTDFNLDLTQHMSEKNCSFLLLRPGKSDQDPCRPLQVTVTPPGIAGLSGLEWTSINKRPCTVDALHWMEDFHPSLQFFGTLVPISTTYTDQTPRVGEYRVQSGEPLWALNQCDFPLYAYFPDEGGAVLAGIFVIAAIIAIVGILICCCAVLLCCFEK